MHRLQWDQNKACAHRMDLLLLPPWLHRGGGNRQGRARLLPEQEHSTVWSPLLQSQGCCQVALPAGNNLQSSSCLGSSSLERVLLPLFWNATSQTAQQQGGAQKPQPQSRLDFNVRKDTGLWRRFSAGVFIPLVHTGFSLI